MAVLTIVQENSNPHYDIQWETLAFTMITINKERCTPWYIMDGGHGCTEYVS